MKKVSLILIAILAVIVLKAQGEGQSISGNAYLSPGVMYMGGSIGFSGISEKHEDSGGSEDGPTFSSFNILPEFGYVLTDKIALAIGIGYESNSYKRIQSGFAPDEEFELKDKSGSFIINPMVKMYKQINNRLYCMPSFGIGLGFGSATDQSLEYDPNDGSSQVMDTEYKEFSWGLSFRPALKYFIDDQYALTFSYGNLYYGSNTSTSKEDDSVKWKTNSYGFDLSLNTVQLGFVYVF